VQGQKSPEIGLGNSHDAAEGMGNKLTAVDPASDGSSRHAQHFRRLGDGEKLDSVATVTAAGAFRNRRFSPNASRSPSSLAHSPHLSTAERTSRFY
ncbi:MAG: hypothetical protein WA851_24705, partial [Xanthobacteraceae bacterium]